LGLQQAVIRLHKFAPPTFSFPRRVVEEPDPGGAHDDDDDDDTEENKDKNKGPSSETEKGHGAEKQEEATKLPPPPPVEAAPAYPVCWFEDEGTELPLRWQLFAGILWDSHQQQRNNNNNNNNNSDLVQIPWKIRLHFTSYPSSQLLELEGASGVLTTIERSFKDSLKQALVLQHGNNKTALNMTKQSHQRLWDSIVTSKYSVYKPIQENIQATSNLALIPIRVLIGSSSKPLIQKRCDDQSLTLGQLLQLWIPQHFVRVEEEDDATTLKYIQPKLPDTQCRVSGIVPPLSALVVDLWRTLCHPDNFLYISVVTQ
jgi:autophagy-related protein 5